MKVVKFLLLHFFFKSVFFFFYSSLGWFVCCVLFVVLFPSCIGEIEMQNANMHSCILLSSIFKITLHSVSLLFCFDFFLSLANASLNEQF